MGTTNMLRSPTPRREPLPETDFQYRIRRTRSLPIPRMRNVGDPLHVLNARQTRREFTQISIGKLAELLWHSARTRSSFRDTTGRRYQSRPAPSAGACHPHDLLIMRRRAGKLTVHLYDPLSHALAEVRVNARMAESLHRRACESLPVGRGTLIWLVGRPSRTHRYYRYPESLLWRDAGALTAVLAIAAEALDLALCPLGMTGEPEISRLFHRRAGVQGFGGLIVGARSAAGSSA